MKKEDNNGKLKVFFLSNFTIEPILKMFVEECKEIGIKVEAKSAPYGQYFQEIVNTSSNLYTFSPQIIFLMLDAEKLLGDAYIAPYSLEDSVRKSIFSERLAEIKNLLNILKEKSSAKIVINDLLLPVHSALGVIENKRHEGVVELVKYFNEELRSLAKKDSQLFVFDFNLFCMREGHSFLIDKRVDYLADMKLSIPALKKLSREYTSYIIPAASKTKKCLVLDLDNTLWGGVVGEVGPKGIKLGPEKEGKSFLDFQRKILELFNNGIILAINSKNNLDDAMDVIRNHEYMILREDNFASMKINWQDKVTNMKEIAEELNIGLDSFVFLDDDKANRALIREFLPEIEVVDLPEDHAYYSDCLEKIKLFSKLSSTKEDFERGKMYVDQRKRESARLNSESLEEFIKSLEIVWSMNLAKKEDVARISQLTQKTNQFNLTTKRYSEEEIMKFLNSHNHKVWYVKVKDKFGDYGVTGVIIIEVIKDAKRWDIDTFLLSCRILGKNVEFSLMNFLEESAKKEDIAMIGATFITTAKNSPSKDFLRSAQFQMVSEEGDIRKYEKILWKR